MTVALTPEQERFARSLVSSGCFRSTNEVVSSGLQLLEEQEAETAGLRAKIQEALDSGPPISMTREEIREMMGKRMAELHAEVERGERPPPGGPDSIPN